MTTSPVAFTFSSVCLMVLSLTLLEGENMRVAGLLPKTLKKLKGDKLGCPSALTVLAKQIGLGATLPNKYPCRAAVLISPGMIFICQIQLCYTINNCAGVKFSKK